MPIPYGYPVPGTRYPGSLQQGGELEVSPSALALRDCVVGYCRSFMYSIVLYWWNFVGVQYDCGVTTVFFNCIFHNNMTMI